MSSYEKISWIINMQYNASLINLKPPYNSFNLLKLFIFIIKIIIPQNPAK